jgi:hypothetical protein
MSKIQRKHLDRAAYVYVRQSSLAQIEQNLESQRLIARPPKGNTRKNSSAAYSAVSRLNKRLQAPCWHRWRRCGWRHLLRLRNSWPKRGCRNGASLSWSLNAPVSAGRCRRQYDAVEPENRLVAKALERRWKEALERAALEQALNQ